MPTGGGRPMSNEIAIQDNANATMLEIRMDSKRFPRLCRYSKEEAVFHMTKIVSKAFMYKGQAADPANISFVATNLVDELMKEDRYGARYLSFEEISRIVNDAVLTDTEMYGVSVASLYRVIIAWCKGEGSRIQNQAAELKKQQDAESLKRSVIAPMLQAYTNEFIKNHKIK